jgi:2-polyprenyl-3-methyl-5-hydroxy-6-metoxy-1,4-benzoquinol methylase
MVACVAAHFFIPFVTSFSMYQMSATVPSSNDEKAKSAGTHSLDQMRSYYEQYAAHYREFVEPTNTCLGNIALSLLFLLMYQCHMCSCLSTIGRSVANAMKMHSATSVLEVGAGTGLLAVELARQFYGPEKRATPPVCVNVSRSLSLGMIF